MQVQLSPFSIGSIIALIVLVLCILLVVIGHLPLLLGALLGFLALARLC